jgi:hypothetical protein
MRDHLTRRDFLAASAGLTAGAGLALGSRLREGRAAEAEFQTKLHKALIRERPAGEELQRLKSAGFDGVEGGVVSAAVQLCEGTRWQERAVPANPAGDVYFPIQQAALSLAPDDAHLRVSVQTMTPNRKGFQARIDSGAWKPAGESFVWNIHPGANRLEVKTVNRFGLSGSSSTVQVEQSN